MQRDVHEQRRNHSPLRASLGGRSERTANHDASVEPRFAGRFYRRWSIELAQEGAFVNVVKASLNVRIQDEFRLGVRHCVDGGNGILPASSWSKAITMCLETGFPFRFDRQLIECLMCPVEQHRNA